MVLFFNQVFRNGSWGAKTKRQTRNKVEDEDRSSAILAVTPTVTARLDETSCGVFSTVDELGAFNVMRTSCMLELFRSMACGADRITVDDVQVQVGRVADPATKHVLRMIDLGLHTLRHGHRAGSGS